MALYDSGVQKDLRKIRRQGQLNRISTQIEARTAAQNRDLRDTKATNLFSDIVDAYVSKVKTNNGLKITLFIVSLVILIAFATAFIICLFSVINNKADLGEILSILIPAGAAVVTSIISIIIIIAKYLFPQDEDKNFTDLVKVLHKKNKENKENDG